jgi:hypothetical protein
VLADLLAARIRTAVARLIEQAASLTGPSAPPGGYAADALTARPLLNDLISQAVTIDLHIGPGIDAVTTAPGVFAPYAPHTRTGHLACH